MTMSEQHNETELQDRLRFLGIDAEAKALLKTLQPMVSKNVLPALAVFYEKVRATPQTARFMRDEQMSIAPATFRPSTGN